VGRIRNFQGFERHVPIAWHAYHGGSMTRFVPKSMKPEQRRSAIAVFVWTALLCCASATLTGILVACSQQG